MIYIAPVLIAYVFSLFFCFTYVGMRKDVE